MGIVDPTFFRTIWGPLKRADFSLFGELRAFGTDGKTYQSFHDDRDAMALACENLSSTHDVYYGVLPRTSRQGSAEHTIPTTHVLWADFDAKNFSGKTGARSAFAEVAQMRLSPHIIVDSGHGYHAYWLLDDEYDFADAKAVMQGIEREHGSDHCSDAARILRVPGTINHKNGDRLSVRVVKFDATSSRYNLGAFYDYTVRAQPKPRDYAAMENSEWTPSDEDAPPIGEGDRNHGLLRVAGAMIRRNVSSELLPTLLLIENQKRCEPPLEEGEVLAIARSAERYR